MKKEIREAVETAFGEKVRLIFPEDSSEVLDNIARATEYANAYSHYFVERNKQMFGFIILYLPLAVMTWYLNYKKLLNFDQCLLLALFSAAYSFIFSFIYARPESKLRKEGIRAIMPEIKEKANPVRLQQFIDKIPVNNDGKYSKEDAEWGRLIAAAMYLRQNKMRDALYAIGGPFWIMS